MFRFNFDFEETDCSQQEKARITPCENKNETVTPVSQEGGLQAFSYDEKALMRYFIQEGWSEPSSIELAKGMIKRGSYLPFHEHQKYLKCERLEDTQ